MADRRRRPRAPDGAAGRERSGAGEPRASPHKKRRRRRAATLEAAGPEQTRIEVLLPAADPAAPAVVPYPVELVEGRQVWARATWYEVTGARPDPTFFEGAAIVLSGGTGADEARVSLDAAWRRDLGPVRLACPRPRPGASPPWHLFPHRAAIAPLGPGAAAAALAGLAPGTATVRGLRGGGAPLEDPSAAGRPLDRRIETGQTLRLDYDVRRRCPYEARYGVPPRQEELERLLGDCVAGAGPLYDISHADVAALVRAARLIASPAFTPDATIVEIVELLFETALFSPSAAPEGLELISAVDAVVRALELRCAGDADAGARLAALRTRYLSFTGPSCQAARNYELGVALEALGEMFQLVPDRSPLRAGQPRFHDPGAIRNCAAVATRLERATSAELACVAAVALAERGVLGVELMGVTGHHGFAVIARSPDSDLARPETWGPNCVVCDPYVRETYFAAEWVHVLGAREPRGDPMQIYARRFA